MSTDESDGERVVAVTANGQATIPKEYREELGVETPGRVKFVRTSDGDIVVRPARSVADLRGMLADDTDDEGRSGVERLRKDRAADEAEDRERRSGGEES